MKKSNVNFCCHENNTGLWNREWLWQVGMCADDWGGLLQTKWSGKNHLRRLRFESNPESWKGPALLSSLGRFAKEKERLSLLQYHSSNASILLCSAFFIVHLSHPYMTTRKTTALTRWTFVGKVMCLLFNMLSAAAAAAAAKSLQLCLTLCDPIDGSPPGSPVPVVLQARTLEWVAISFSNAWKWKVKVKSLSSVRLFATPWTVAYQAPV